MISIEQLDTYLGLLLSSSRFRDYCPNGLQVQGKSPIRRLVTGVTASQAVIDAAITNQADLLLVHHGLFWQGDPAPIVGWKHRRLKALLMADINLVAYHLPLDAHPIYGNNVQLAQVLGLHTSNSEQLGPDNLLLLANSPQPLACEQFSQQLSQQLRRPPLLIRGGNHSISRVAICTGAAQKMLEQAASLGVDAFLSGEASENTYHLAKELGIHYFGLGHHASERYGVQALGEHLANEFGLEHQFIDSDNPV